MVIELLVSNLQVGGNRAPCFIIKTPVCVHMSKMIRFCEVFMAITNKYPNRYIQINALEVGVYVNPC